MLADNFPTLFNTLCHAQTTPTKAIKSLMKLLVNNQLSDIQTGAFLAALNIKGIDENSLTAAVEVLQKYTKPFPGHNMPLLIDCVGTGGDGLCTYNISTIASLVLSSMGLPVAKHGNTKVSSKCGSADLMGMLDINIDLTPEQAKYLLDKHQFCFLAAPYYHPGVKHAAKARADLKGKTLFNLVGPLLNPAKPTHVLLGVASVELLPIMAQTLINLKVQNALVVHGSGMDELTVHGPSHGYLIKNGRLSPFSITPEALGIKPFSLDSLMSLDPEKNRQAALDCLMGHGLPALKAIVALNAGAVLFLAEQVPTIQQGYQKVLSHLSTDKAYQHCLYLAQESQNVK